MKKIISLFITTVMLLTVFSSFALVASANDTPTVSVELANVSDETFAVGTTFELHVKYAGVPVSENEEDWAGEGVSYLSFQLEVPNYGTMFKSNGKTWVVDSLGSASSSSAVKNMDGTVYKYDWTGPVTADTVYRVGEGTVAVIKLKVNEEITSNVEFNLAQAWVETLQFDAEEKKIGGGKWTSIAGNGEEIVIDDSAAVIVVSGGSDGEEGSDILDKVAPEAKTAEATYQIGTGVGMTVTAPEGVAFTKMIWAITKGAERVYSDKVDFPFAVSGDVRVAATFVNGTHNGNYKDAEVKESYEIGEDDFDAIFCGVDAEGIEADYFTNEADAANKAE